MITNSPASSSPFIVGLAGHPDLEPAQIAPLVDSAVGFLRDLKQHLPDTDVRLLLEVGTSLNLAIVRAALELGIFVDALIAKPVRQRASGADEPMHIGRPHYLLAAGDNVLDVQQSMPSSLKRQLEDFNGYNLECRQIAGGGRTESLMRHLPAELTAGDAAALQYIDSRYAKADSLAGYMQWRSDRLFNMFGIMAFMMGLAYLIYDKITESRILLIVYMLILFTGSAAYYFFQAKRWFSKYLSTRVLAETLRVKSFFWRLPAWIAACLPGH